MIVQEMPCCCGIMLLGQFLGDKEGALTYSNEKIEEFLTNRIEQANHEGWSLIQVNLNGYQYNKYEDLFKSFGFKNYIKSYHRDHNSWIYVLIKQVVDE